MPNIFFQFKNFIIHQERCAMKVTTDACLFGAWVAGEVGSLQSTVGDAKMLDIGTGTGLLSLIVAQKIEALINAIEIDAVAAEQAKENVAASPWKECINIIQADVRQWQNKERYDCIFSNPPFYENDLKSSAANKNVAHHDAGLRLEELVFFIKNQLAKSGSFFLLLPTRREKELGDLLGENNLFIHQKIFVQQSSNHTPFRMMIQGGREQSKNVEQRTISIKNGDGNYTPEFVALLKDYYLYL